MKDEIKTIDPFTNIPIADLPTADQNPPGASFLPNVRELNIGDGGSNVCRADKSGLWLGAKLFANAPFRVSMAGDLTASSLSITGGTITGATIQTAASGQRTTITALSAGIQFYNTDGTNIATLQPTDAGALFSATSPNTASRMFQFVSFVQNGSNSNPMVYLEAADVGTGTTLLSLVQKGDKAALTIDLATSSSGHGLVITHLGDGYCADFYLNNSSANSNAVRVRSTATAIAAFYAEHSVNTMTPAEFKQSGAVVANTHNYYRVLKLNGGGITKHIWISDGNSPNTDALSGGIGDICLNCDGGKTYFNNNGSTGWTAM